MIIFHKSKRELFFMLFFSIEGNVKLRKRNTIAQESSSRATIELKYERILGENPVYIGVSKELFLKLVRVRQLQ